MQMRPRGVAAITALLFVVCGLLSARHEANTTHVRDRAGAFLHASSLIGHHAGRNVDIHRQRDPHSDAGECALLTAFHQAASAEFAAPAIASTVRTPCVHDSLRAAVTPAVTDVYRLAPKTSPPRAA
jgi:hypothetical protein